jgi:putative MFS transporter
MYFTPEGNWQYLTVFRFLTGFGVGGLYSIDLPLVQEFVPSKLRGRVSGVITSFVPIGTMCASTLAAYITPMIGWRGLFLIGLIPAALTLLIRAWVPESPRWLIKNGRFTEAEAAVNWVTLQSNTFVHDKDAEKAEKPAPAEPIKFSELFRYKRSVAVTWTSNAAQQCAYYCFTMWGPTLLALVAGKTPQQAAKLFIFVTLGGFIGRWTWAFVGDAIGRRKTGVILGIGAAIMLLVAMNTTGVYIGETPVFWLSMIGVYFFADGGFALTGPYGTEPWPQRLKATGMGSAYGMGGIGKIIGPMVVAIFAGSSNIVSPQATADAIIPVYVFIAATMIIMAITFYFALETKGKSIEQIEAELEATARK